MESTILAKFIINPSISATLVTAALGLLTLAAFGVQRLVRWKVVRLGYEALVRLAWLAIPIRLFMGLFM